MSIFSSPEEHAAHPPQTWTVRKHGRRWALYLTDRPSEFFSTKHEAEAAKTSGFLFDLYEKEKRWYAGESVPGWKPHQPIPERQLPWLTEKLRSLIDAHGTNSFFDSLAHALRLTGKMQSRWTDGAAQLFDSAADVMETTRNMLAIERKPHDRAS